ncbi:MAG: LysR substrate-binding domain-containing protein [Reyranellaceae bacterium]
MNLRQIETFLAVIEEGTFSAGAARLKVSQPTVSKLIDALERGLGYKLFRRMGLRVVPTDQGMALYREMTRVKRGFDLLLEQARDLKKGCGGRLVIGVGSALAPAFMPALIARFMALHPEAHVTFEADGARYLIEQFLAGSIDIGFATRTLRSRALTGVGTIPAEQILVGREMCALPAGHRLASKAMIDMADLDGEPFIGVTADIGSRRHIDAVMMDSEVKVRLVADASTPVAACALVGRGVGITIVSDLSVQAAAAVNGGIVARPIQPSVGYSIDMAISPAIAENPLAVALRKLALAEGPALHRELVASIGA